MAATIPQLGSHLPDLLEFVSNSARQIETGELADGDALAQRLRDFYTADRMRAIEVVAPGWHDMAAAANGATLNHITQALIALQLLPEYRHAQGHLRALLEWSVLYHDLGKQVIAGQRDALHAFRSATMAARTLPSVGFPVTEAYRATLEPWTRLVLDASVAAPGGKRPIVHIHERRNPVKSIMAGSFLTSGEESLRFCLIARTKTVPSFAEMSVSKKRIVRASLFALAAMVAAAAAAAAETVAVAHRLAVELILSENRLIGRDQMRLGPSERSELVIFLSERARRVRVEVNGSRRMFDRSAATLRVPLHANERGSPVQVDVAYEAVFDDPVPVNPLNTDNPGFGVAAAITAEGVFLLAGAGWYPDLTDSRPSFHLTVKAPPGILAVTAGRSLGHTDRDGATVSEWHIDHPVRGLALSAAAYRVQERTVGQVVIATYFREPNQELASAYLEATAGYLALYERLFGPYPFPKFAVVENFFPTGYGFPSYTLIGDTVLRLPFIIATSLGHEIAHCWWGNGVFVDHSAGNWSEGLTTYVADYLYQERKSPEDARSARLQMIRNYSTLAPPEKEIALARFVSRTDPMTKAVGYDKGAMVFHMLRKEVGEEAFWAALRDLYASHLFRPASWADIQQTVEARSGRSLEWFFEQWVRRAGAPRLRLEGVHTRTTGGAWSIDGRLVQDPPHFRATGDAAVDSGARIETHPIELTGGSATFSLAATQKPIGLTVDPDSHHTCTCHGAAAAVPAGGRHRPGERQPGPHAQDQHGSQSMERRASEGAQGEAEITQKVGHGLLPIPLQLPS